MAEENYSDFKYADILGGPADKLADLAWRKPVGLPPTTVYHYTNADGLFGILSSKRVWATDYRFLNDEMESEIGQQRAKEIIRAAYFKADDGPLRKFYKEALEALRAQRAEDNFLFSLSSRRDDLSQWRAYANEGEGFTVGFDTKKMLSVANTPDAAFGFGKVSYSSADFDKKIRSALSTFEKIIIKKSLSGKDHAILIEEAALHLEMVVSTYRAAYKHSSFRSEFEWRVNTFVEPGDPDNDVRVRSNGKRLVPYVPIKLCEADNECLPITHIGIGPGFRDRGVRYAVEKLCQQFDVKAKIYDADTPFRRM